MISGADVVGCRFGLQTGQAVVLRDLPGWRIALTAAPDALGQRCRGPAVEQPPACQARLIVNQRAQLFMSKVVPRDHAGILSYLSDYPPVGQHLQRRDNLFVASATGHLYRPQVEGAADDRSSLERLLRCDLHPA